ncbi:MAG: Lrp/AsnC family transcriptional regulator [Alphaproteobacteria bacterium]
MDNIDKKILTNLQQDGRISNANLSDAVGLSPSACLRRVQSLEESGVIDGYSADINHDKMGYKTLIMLMVTLAEQGEDKLRNFEEEITKIPQVIQCHLMGGRYDYLVKIAVRDIQDYEEIHRHKLSKLTNVSMLQSYFSMREIINRSIPIL